MPQAFVAKIAARKGVSIDTAEGWWNTAKRIAAEKGAGYGLVTHIFKGIAAKHGADESIDDLIPANVLETDVTASPPAPTPPSDDSVFGGPLPSHHTHITPPTRDVAHVQHPDGSTTKIERVPGGESYLVHHTPAHEASPGTMLVIRGDDTAASDFTHAHAFHKAVKAVHRGLLMSPAAHDRAFSHALHAAGVDHEWSSAPAVDKPRYVGDHSGRVYSFTPGVLNTWHVKSGLTSREDDTWSDHGHHESTVSDLGKLAHKIIHGAQTASAPQKVESKYRPYRPNYDR